MYTKEIALAVIEGVVSIPTDLALGLRRTFEDFGGSGRIVRLENAAERQRASLAIKNAIDFAKSNSGPIGKIVTIILNELYGFVPDDTLEKIAKKAGLGASFLGTRVATQIALVDVISKMITQQVAVLFLAKRTTKIGVGVVFSLILVQGLFERASEAGKRLQVSHPKIYIELKGQNLDMAYFIVEGAMIPVMEAIRAHNTNKKQFKKLLKDIENDYLY